MLKANYLAGVMKILAFFLLIFVFPSAKSSAVDLASGHSFSAALDESQKVKLYWNDDTAKKDVSFTVEAQTTGWIGFGISSGQGKMAGADIVIGWVKDGKPYFKVRFWVGVLKITVICSPQQSHFILFSRLIGFVV